MKILTNKKLHFNFILHKYTTCTQFIGKTILYSNMHTFDLI